MSNPHNNDTYAYELRQNGSKIPNSEPRKNDKGQNATTASGVMIHVGGIYRKEEENVVRHSGSLACFGIVNDNNSFRNPSDKEANRVIGGIRQQSDNDSIFGHSNVKVIIQPRNNVQRSKEVIKPSSAR